MPHTRVIVHAHNLCFLGAQEKCVGGMGKRSLLLFDTITANVGTSPVVLGKPSLSDDFVYDTCHHHFHRVG